MSRHLLLDHVLVEPIEHEEKTSGGLYLAEVAKKRPVTAKVVTVGPGRRNESGLHSPMDVQVGDVVTYHEFAGTEIQIDNRDFLVLREEEILMVER